MKRDRRDEAFDRLYTEHAAGLLGFLTYQTGDRSLAEDIVADTFERVLRGSSGWRGQSGEKTWLYAIAMNRLRDLARRRGAEARALERVASAPRGRDELDAVGERDLLERALQTLPEEERAVVALRFGGDLALREIAELLDERQSTVEGRLYRGLRRLRDIAG
ncbi:MAG TPA: sigma-70 family RNA polymerase sigma factor [Solirubrobacteraceae bacterium]|nr:sigma-70 family RNA polymerase sigma factor [Solirubrobacteraceae bacterium]